MMSIWCFFECYPEQFAIVLNSSLKKIRSENGAARPARILAPAALRVAVEDLRNLGPLPCHISSHIFKSSVEP